MEAYSDFALVYDTLMDNTPYERWCELIVGILKRYGISAEGIVQVWEKRNDWT